VITGLALAVGVALLCYALSGARSSAYLLYFLAFIPFVSFDPMSGGLQDLGGLGGQNVVIKMALRTVTSAGFVLLLMRRREALHALLAPACLPIVGYFLWALVGTYRAQSPWVSLFRLGELLAFFVAGVTLYLEAGRFRGPRELARWHCLALLPLCVITLYFAQVKPELAFHVGPGGLKRLGHKFIEANILGFAAVAVNLWATSELKDGREGRRNRWLEQALPLIALCISIYILVVARSRTAMITAVVGQLVLWFPYLGSSPRRQRLFGGFLLVGMALTVLNLDLVTAWFLRGDGAASLATGTGRTGLWSALLAEQVPRSPMLGAGYLMLGARGAFEHAGTLWNNAHNTYMFALVATGIPGLLLILWISVHPVWCLLRRVHTAPQDERASWALLLAMMVVIGITNVTGFGVSGFPNAAMFFFYSLYAVAVLPRPGDHAPSFEPERVRPFPSPEATWPARSAIR
jgi:O-antigen ligase